MEYEWDETKRQLNVRKHGLDFVDVDEVFSDPNGIEYKDVIRKWRLLNTRVNS